MNPYYIKNKLKIDIPLFASVCGKILNMKFKECIHIIFYLIYGRLATTSYVEAISRSQYFIEKKEKLKVTNSIKNFRFKEPSKEKKKLNYYEEELSLTEELKREIKDILRP